VNSGPTHLKVFADTTRPRGRGWLWLAAFAAALALYVLTLSPDLTWQDSGEYQRTAAQLTWPPGTDTVWCRPGEAVRVHPWFLVTAHALALPGTWNYAYAANLSSAVAMALAAANVVLLVYLMTRLRWAAAVAGLAFALGHTVWMFGVMSEVLGWTAAFLSAECLCAWAWSQRRQERWWLLLFFLNGVAVSNHLMAAFSAGVFALWLLIECLRRRTRGWVLPAAVGLWLAGGTLYWIVLGVEYARTGGLAETLLSATVGGFAAKVSNLSSLAGLLAKSVLYVGLNYPTPVGLAGLAAVVVLCRRRDAFSWVLLALASVYFLWAARYNVPDQFSFFVPFYVLASVLIGIGVAAIAAWRGRWVAPVCLVLAVVPVVVYAVLPHVARQAGFVFVKRELPYRDPYTYFLRPWKCGDRSARRYAEEALAALPERGILLPDTTASTPLKCVHDVEGVRPDVLIVDGYDAKFVPSLRPFWGTDASVLSGPAAAGRRVFVTSDVPGYLPKWVGPQSRLEPVGPVFEVTSPRAEEAP